MKAIPREVGKSITHSRELRELRVRLALTEYQKQIATGSLLGDGSLIPNAWGKGYRLQIEQGERQKDYCFWKYETLKDFVLSVPQFQENKKSWKFRTISHPEFTQMATEWYDEYRQKIIPTIMNNFSPLALAVWYMDDGGLRKEHGKIYGAFLNTQSFSPEDNKILQKLLVSYGIETLLMPNKGKIRLYIPNRILSAFRKLIESYIHESMRYKLF